MRSVLIHCVGVSPLMLDQMSDETLESLRTGVRLPEVKDRPAIEVARAKIYRNSEGQIALPANMITAALVNAGRKVKNGRKQISTATTTTLFDFLQVTSVELVLTRADGAMDDNGDIPWVVDKRKGTGNQAKTPTAVCVTRPKFDKWEFDLEIEYDNKQINTDVVRLLVSTALSSEGLGSFRPNKKGPFGRSKIASWAERDEDGNIVTTKQVAVAESVPEKKATRTRKAVNTEEGNGEGKLELAGARSE